MSERISDEMLSAYFDGEASPEEAALIERSLESNSELVKKLDEWKALRRAIEHLPTYRTSDGMHLTIMSAIAKGQSDANQSDSNTDVPDGLVVPGKNSAELSVGNDQDVMSQALQGNVPLDHGADRAPTTDSPMQWRWAIGLFATVAAVVLIAIFYNPTQFRVDPNQIARDETADDYRAARERFSDGLSTNGDDEGGVDAGDSSGSESLPGEPMAVESMMQLAVPPGQRPENDADGSLGPSGGFGGGGPPLQKSAEGQPAGGTPLVASPEERQFGGNRGGQGGGGEQKGGGIGQSDQPHEPAGSSRGAGGGAPAERGRTVPADQRDRAQSRMGTPVPGRGGRESGDFDPTPEERQNNAVDSESPMPPARMMMRAANPGETGGSRESRTSQGRFYAVIDLDVPNPRTLIERGVADLAGEDVGEESQTGRRFEENQDDLQLADATRPALPALLEQMGFVQVERMQEKEQQPQQPLGIVEQIASDHDRESYFRLKQDLPPSQAMPAPQAMMAQADSIQADSNQANRVEVAPAENDDRPLPPSSIDGPSTMAIDADELGDATGKVRVEFYEFEADANDVNQLIARLAERGVDVNLFFSQPVGNEIAGSRAAPDNGLIRGGIEPTQSFDAANAPPDNARSKLAEPESSGGGERAPEEVATQPAEAALADTAVEAGAGQDSGEQLERLGWDAVVMRPLLETRTAELAMMQQGQLQLGPLQQGQRLANQVQPNAEGESGEGQSLGRSAFGSPETRQSGGAGEPSQPQLGQDESASANRPDKRGVDALNNTPALEGPNQEQEQVDELGGAAGKTLTLDELSRSRTSYFWQGQTYIESNVAADGTLQNQADKPRRPQVTPPIQSVRPPRPTPQDQSIDALPNNRTRIENGDAQGATPTGNPIGQELNRLIPQFSRAGRVRLTLVVRTPIASLPPAEENANPSPSSAGSGEPESNSTKSESPSGNDR